MMPARVYIEGRKVFIKGHYKTRECNTLTNIARALEESGRFKTIKIENGDAEFECLNDEWDLLFESSPLKSATVVYFDDGVALVELVCMDNNDKFNGIVTLDSLANGEYTDYATEYMLAYRITCKPGFEVDGVVSCDADGVVDAYSKDFNLTAEGLYHRTRGNGGIEFARITTKRAIPEGYRLLSIDDVGKTFGVDLEPNVWIDTSVTPNDLSAIVANREFLTSPLVKFVAATQVFGSGHLMMCYDDIDHLVEKWGIAFVNAGEFKRWESEAVAYVEAAPLSDTITGWSTEYPQWNNWLYVADIAAEPIIPDGYRLLDASDVGKTFGVDLSSHVYYDTSTTFFTAGTGLEVLRAPSGAMVRLAIISGTTDTLLLVKNIEGGSETILGKNGAFISESIVDYPNNFTFTITGFYTGSDWNNWLYVADIAAEPDPEEPTATLILTTGGDSDAQFVRLNDTQIDPGTYTVKTGDIIDVSGSTWVSDNYAITINDGVVFNSDTPTVTVDGLVKYEDIYVALSPGETCTIDVNYGTYTGDEFIPSIGLTPDPPAIIFTVQSSTDPDPEPTDTKPVYLRKNGAWVKVTAFERVNGEWVQISTAEEAPAVPQYPITYSVSGLEYDSGWPTSIEYGGTAIFQVRDAVGSFNATAQNADCSVERILNFVGAYTVTISNPTGPVTVTMTAVLSPPELIE